MQIRLFKNLVLITLLIFTVSCAKEIYSDAEARAAKLDAQKVGLTVMVRDMNNPLADMDGFTISSTQCDDKLSITTSGNGVANMMMVRGEAILLIEKEGYPATIAVVSLETQSTERTNSVVVVPVFANTQVAEAISGTVSNSSSLVPNALVSIDVDMDELINSAFSGLSSELRKYRPSAIAYDSESLMQPIRTNSHGAFQFRIPTTPTELTYTVNVRETTIEQDYYTGQETVITNGKNSRSIDIHLTPYGK